MSGRMWFRPTNWAPKEPGLGRYGTTPTIRMMQLLCVSNRAADLGPLQLGRATQPDVVFDLTVGRRYSVVGMVLWETMLWLLVRSDSGDPLNAPAGLFDGVPTAIPKGWGFAVGPGANRRGEVLNAEPMVGVWGYAELIDDPRNIERLFEGESEAIAAFAQQFVDQAGHDRPV